MILSAADLRALEGMIERAVRAALLAHKDDLVEREERERQEEMDEWIRQMELKLEATGMIESTSTD